VHGWQVFLKYFHIEQLNIAVNETQQRITVCQKYVRGFTARRHYAHMKQLARKCEEDMKLLNDTVGQTTDHLKPLQKKLHDEDVRHQDEKLRAAEEERRKLEEEKRKLEEEQEARRKLEEKMNAEKQKIQVNNTVW